MTLAVVKSALRAVVCADKDGLSRDQMRKPQEQPLIRHVLCLALSRFIIMLMFSSTRSMSVHFFSFNDACNNLM